MSRVHRRGVIAGSRSGAKTYADFEAHITVLAVDGPRVWNGSSAWVSGSWTATCNPASGSMIGSSWNTAFRGALGNTTTSRAIQHAISSALAFTDQVDNSRMIFFKTSAIGSIPSGYSALDRNGFTSTSSASTTMAVTITELIRWDTALQKAFQSNPSIGGAETEYTW